MRLSADTRGVSAGLLMIGDVKATASSIVDFLTRG